MSKFTFKDSVSPEMVTVLKRYLLPCEWLVPDWCNEVLVEWSDEASENDSVIEAWLYYEYRWGKLIFYPCFLSQTENARHTHVVHDMLHLFVSVVSEYAEDTIKVLLPEDEEPKFRKHAIAELRRRNESLVQDLALCIMRNLSSAKMKSEG